MSISSVLKEESGTALIVSLMALLILSIIGVSVLSLNLGQLTVTAHDRQSLIAFNAADAGVVRAIWRLNQNAYYLGESAAVGGGEYNVAVETPLGYPGSRIITSTGFYPNMANPTLRRKIVANAELRPSHAFDFAILANSGITLEDNVRIDSTPLSGQGNIHSNSNIMAEDDVYVDGMATAVGSVQSSGGSTFTQGAQDGAETVVFPAVDSAVLKAQAQANGETWGNVVVQGTTVTTLTGLIHGNLRIEDHAQVTFSGVVYVEGNIDIGDRSTITGNDAVVAEGSIKIEDHVALSSSGVKLTLISLKTGEEAIVIEDNSNTMDATLWAPYGEVVLEDDVKILGSVIGTTVSVEDDVMVTFDTDQRLPSAIPSSWVVVSWREVSP
jgi:hypothetical protein